MNKDTLLVLSGGMDSTTMLYEYRDRIAMAVSFNYGSNHNERELECAAYNCQLLGIPHKVINLAFIGENFKSSLLSGADAIPEGDYAIDNIRSTVVPFRNGIMLAIAAGLAESGSLKAIMMANHSGDHAIYPDCRPEFAEAMATAIAAGTFEHIKLLTPYTNISKTDIARRGAANGLDFSHTYSCYRGGMVHCGRCATCLERRQALAEAGVTDTTVYEV